MHSPVPASHRPFNEQSKSEAHPTTADVPVSAKNIIIIIEIKIWVFILQKTSWTREPAGEGVLTYVRVLVYSKGAFVSVIIIIKY